MGKFEKERDYEDYLDNPRPCALIYLCSQKYITARI